MTPERIRQLRDEARLQLARHRELGGKESNYQVAIDPSELAMFLHALINHKTAYAQGEQSGIDHVKCVAKITDGRIDFSDVEHEEVDVYP